MSLYLAGGAAVIGALFGLVALMLPAKAAEIVHLRPDWDTADGFADFRATYGGMILMAHAAILLTIYMQEQAGMGSVIATSFAVGAGWLGAALGRTLSMLVDHAEHRTRTAHNALTTLVELAMALALLSPWLGHLRGF